jgi:hypothetical protein
MSEEALAPARISGGVDGLLIGSPVLACQQGRWIFRRLPVEVNAGPATPSRASVPTKSSSNQGTPNWHGTVRLRFASVGPLGHGSATICTLDDRTGLRLPE